MNKANILDLVGKKFNRLTVLEYAKTYKESTIVKCICDCGNVKEYYLYKIRNSHTKSCGCLRKDCPSKFKHGETRSKLYSVWNSMKERCFNINNLGYKRYGGRGINVCRKWKNSYIEFRNWANSHGYNMGLQIDRINNNGNYTPKNCRWVTKKINLNNTRRNHYITLNGEKKTVSEWSEILNIPVMVIFSRIHRLKWLPEKALTTPVRLITIKNKTMILVSFCCGAICSTIDEDEGICPRCGKKCEFVNEDDEAEEYPRRKPYTKPEYNIFGKIDDTDD